jgi:hypothetical protein
MNEALLNEFEHGMKSLNSKESQQGAQQFTQGKGRHGAFAFAKL